MMTSSKMLEVICLSVVLLSTGPASGNWWFSSPNYPREHLLPPPQNNYGSHVAPFSPPHIQNTQYVVPTQPASGFLAVNSDDFKKKSQVVVAIPQETIHKSYDKLASEGNQLFEKKPIQWFDLPDAPYTYKPQPDYGRPIVIASPSPPPLLPPSQNLRQPVSQPQQLPSLSHGLPPSLGFGAIPSYPNPQASWKEPASDQFLLAPQPQRQFDQGHSQLAAPTIGPCNIDKIEIEIELSDPQKSGSEKTDSEKTDSEKTDSEKTDSEKTDSEKTDSEKTDSEKTDSEKTDSEKSDSTESAFLDSTAPTTSFVAPTSVPTPIPAQPADYPPLPTPEIESTELILPTSESLATMDLLDTTLEEFPAITSLTTTAAP